ncbi:hypothetical protein GN958_ATG01872 [Phytophthora infestans]|uniref:Uncharacterized protein n=1 Tax=Phytophthora infestans TaxID=4787 RepID=A0A8S9V617_PHYIN|nr:hypothetical protein GN958_ATG01872 [Phytophthora infestans]
MAVEVGLNKKRTIGKRPQQEQEINGRTAAERLPNTEQKAQAQGAAKTTTSRATSPKRKLPTAKEAEDRPSKERRQETRIPQGNTRQEARSESPNKRSSVRRGSGDSSCRQQYIHLFLEKTLNKTELEWKNMTAEDGGIAVTAAPPQLPGSTGISLKKDQSDAELTDRSYKEEECRITKILPATNEGKHFNAWMALVGGTIVDVAATGHCGWIAGYAALKNIAEGLLHPGSKLADDINLFKKDVLNGMLANLQDEFAAYPSDLDTELEESGIRTPKDSPFEVRACGLANHYVAQRNKSIKATVSTHYWVRPAHLKGMAIHARQPIYVLDVEEDGRARMQAYSYKRMRGRAGDLFDSGVAQLLTTTVATEMLQDLMAAGILPAILILRWQEQGNHFQAVNDGPERFERYSGQMVEIALRRSEILLKHGIAALDNIQRDQERLTATTAKVLRELRRASKLWQDSMSLEDSGEEDGLVTGATDVLEVAIARQGEKQETSPDVQEATRQSRNEGRLRAGRGDFNLQDSQKVRQRPPTAAKFSVNLAEARQAEPATERNTTIRSAGEANRKHDGPLAEPLTVQIEPSLPVSAERKRITGQEKEQGAKNEETQFHDHVSL